MKQLAIINLNKVLPDKTKDWRFRRAVRAVILDDEKRIAILHVTKHNYHKLPGGGIEKNEDEITALNRESLEEAGCQIEITSQIGSILEYKDQWKIKQESFCYLAKIIGQKQQPEFTDEELVDGFKLLWVDLDTAIKLVESDQPDIYEGQIINARDLTFLQEVKKIINHSRHSYKFVN